MISINKGIDKIISIDPGKNTVNALCYDSKFNLVGHLAFPSIIKKKRSFNDIDSSSPLQFKIEYPEAKYLVGEGIMSNYNFETSKNTIHHKVCVDVAIANFIEEKDERVHIIVGYPSSDYTNAEEKDAYAKLLKGSGNTSIILDGKEKSFEIVSVGIKPEGIAMKPRIEQIKEKTRVKIIDIGGENINYRNYDEKGNTLESESIDSLGINHLESFIKTRLRKYVKVKDVDLNVVNYMKGVSLGYLPEIRPEDISDYKNSQEFMSETIEEFVEDKIIESLDSKMINLSRRGDIILFTGGGSVLLRPYLEKVLEKNKESIIFSNTAYWDNCISYVIKDLGDRYKKAEGDSKENMHQAQIVANKILKESNINDLV